MNSIRQIQELNRRELENNVSPNASWHADYRDTAYIYVGGLPFELSEGDVITIFSQYGEPTYLNLIRDKETGKSRGFAFLKYEDQRSTDLAVDNLGGSVVLNRTLKVDHTRYKKKDDELDGGVNLEAVSEQIEDGEDRRKRLRASEGESEEEQPVLKEERELARIIQEHDEDDPMKAFLIEEKKEKVALALSRIKGRRSSKSHKHRHHHRSRRENNKGGDDSEFRRSHQRKNRDDRDRSSSWNNTKEKDRQHRQSENERSEGRKERRRSPRRNSRGRVVDREWDSRQDRRDDEEADHRSRRD